MKNDRLRSTVLVFVHQCCSLFVYCFSTLFCAQIYHISGLGYACFKVVEICSAFEMGSWSEYLEFKSLIKGGTKTRTLQLQVLISTMCCSPYVRSVCFNLLCFSFYKLNFLHWNLPLVLILVVLLFVTCWSTRTFQN